MYNMTQQSLNPNAIFLCTAETSADVLGARLAQGLRALRPELEIHGIVGESMEQAGVIAFEHIRSLQVMGFSQVFKKSIPLLRLILALRNYIFQQGIALVCCIDSPDLSFFLAYLLRRKGYEGTIVQYVSPTVWAWRKKRVYTIARYMDMLLTLFPFENKLYQEVDLKVVYVGHPLAQLNPTLSKKMLVAIFPGSRREEIQRNLPAQLRAAHAYLTTHTLVISVASNRYKTLIQKILDQEKIECKLMPFEQRFELMSQAAIAIATSGTVTLELALHAVPTLVTYSLTSLNAWLAQNIFKINLPYYCIVNILLQKALYPEYIAVELEDSIMQAKLAQLPTSCDMLQAKARLQQLLTSNHSAQEEILALLPVKNTLAKKEVLEFS